MIVEGVLFYYVNWHILELCEMLPNHDLMVNKRLYKPGTADDFAKIGKIVTAAEWHDRKGQAFISGSINITLTDDLKRLQRKGWTGCHVETELLWDDAGKISGVLPVLESGGRFYAPKSQESAEKEKLKNKYTESGGEQMKNTEKEFLFELTGKYYGSPAEKKKLTESLDKQSKRKLKDLEYQRALKEAACETNSREFPHFVK